MTIHAFDFLYQPSRDEQRAFGNHWCLEGVPGHGVEALCAVYPREHDEGGEVRVYRTAMPSPAYRLVVGDLSFSTGSGAHDLVAKMAEAFATGMLGVSERIPRPE